MEIPDCVTLRQPCVEVPGKESGRSHTVRRAKDDALCANESKSASSITRAHDGP